MTLSRQLFARAEAAEASHLRMVRLQRMNHYELRALLAGDPAEAALWVTSAAEYGLLAAQLRLGRMLLEGQGVSKNPALALLWFTRAAERRDAEAMNMVGRCYDNGWGVASDLKIAARWYKMSAERGHDWGQYNFGNVLFDGRGAAADLPQALLWYWYAARQGHARAMNLLARCCEEGWGCPRDDPQAFEWYRRSAQAGYFRAQYNYAASLADRGLVREAADWFWTAASSGEDKIRRAIAHRLAGAYDPALKAVRARVVKLLAVSSISPT
jgi:TPR repeat protein